MKNIHVLPTDKPSRLYSYKSIELFLHPTIVDANVSNLHCQNQNIYNTDNSKIREGDWVYSEARNTLFKVKSKSKTSVGTLLIEDDVIMPLEINEVDCKKIILTTDQDLIADGVQAIDDEFLEWFVKNPSCEEVEISYGVLKPFQSADKGYMIHLPDNEVVDALREFLTKQDLI